MIIDGKRHAQQRLRLPERWLDAVRQKGHGMEAEIAIDADQRANELLMMGLRLRQGIEVAAFSAETGTQLEDWLNQERLKEMISDGFVSLDRERLFLRERGRPLLNSVIARLLV